MNVRTTYNSNLFWDDKLNTLNRDQRKGFAEKIKSCWSEIAINLKSSQDDIDIIRNKKTRTMRKTGKGDVERRAAQHFIKHCEQAITLGGLYTQLQDICRNDIAVELMGREADFKPKNLLSILNTPLIELLNNHSITSLKSAYKNFILESYTPYTFIHFSIKGFFPKHSTYAGCISLSQHKSVLVDDWMNSEEFTIRNIVSTLNCFKSSEIMLTQLYQHLKDAHKIAGDRYIFLKTNRDSISLSDRSQLSGPLFSIPASILDQDFSNVIDEHFFNYGLEKVVNFENLMKSMTEIFPEIKSSLAEKVRDCQFAKNLFLQSYEEKKKSRNQFNPFGPGYEEMFRQMNALNGLSIITLRQIILGLREAALTNGIKAIKKHLKIEEQSQNIPQTPKDIPQESKESLAPVLRSCGLSIKFSSAPVKEHSVRLNNMLVRRNINFSALLKEFRNIATPIEKKMIADLSISDTPKEIIGNLMQNEAFTYGRLGHCLTVIQADDALESMRDIATIVSEIQEKSKGEPALLSSVITAEVPYANELKSIADQFHLTEENFDISKMYEASVVDAIISKLRSTYPKLGYDGLIEVIVGLNNPIFCQVFKEVYISKYRTELETESFKVNSLAELPNCIICEDKPRNVVYFNCGHIDSCLECFKGLKEKKCPTCRKDVGERYCKVFIA